MKHHSLLPFILSSALSSSLSILFSLPRPVQLLQELTRALPSTPGGAQLRIIVNWGQPWQQTHRRASSTSGSRGRFPDSVNALSSNKTTGFWHIMEQHDKKLQNPQYYPTHSFLLTLITVLLLKLYNLIFNSTPKRQELSNSQSDCTVCWTSVLLLVRT